MRVCTLKNGQVVDRKGNVLYTLKHKGSLLTTEDLLEIRQLSKDLDFCIITASQEPKESEEPKPKESDTPKLPRIYGHCRSRGSMLTPEQLEQLKVSAEAVSKPILLDPEDWRQDS